MKSESTKTKKLVDKENEGDTEHPKASDVEDAGEVTEGSDEGVTVPEEYQQQAHAVTKGATKHHLDHLRSKISEREGEIREEEDAAREKESGGKSKMMFSSKGMPGADNDY